MTFHSEFFRTGKAFQVLPLALWVSLGLLPILALTRSEEGTPHLGLAIAIASLTLFVGALVASFSSRQMRSDPRRNHFFAQLGGLIVAVLLFVLTDNAILFTLGWLGSGHLLARLIGHSSSLAEARDAYRRSMKTFLVGDAAVLAAVVLLCWNARTVDISIAIEASAAMTPMLTLLAALLLLIGAAVRCALPPFSGWLLSSMTAPTPVSALMHAGLVNAGGFLLLRFAPLLEAAPVARYAAVLLGLFAAIWGVSIMAVRPDIKRALAGSTVSQMGFMIMSCGMGAYAAVLWHLVAHGLFKAWLFLNAGSTIGMRRDVRPTLDARSVFIVSALALGIGTFLALNGALGATLVPLLLAFATGGATLVSILVARTRHGSRLKLALAVFCLAVVHALGFGAAQTLLDRPDAPLLSPVLAIVLLVFFLGVWTWQSHRIERRRALPPLLYVRLLNAGNLPTTASGDRS